MDQSQSNDKVDQGQRNSLIVEKLLKNHVQGGERTKSVTSSEKKTAFLMNNRVKHKDFREKLILSPYCVKNQSEQHVEDHWTQAISFK